MEITVIYQCDSCGYLDQREEGTEPELCLVCGEFRWSEVSEQTVIEDSYYDDYLS
jgi:rubredoxin